MAKVQAKETVTSGQPISRDEILSRLQDPAFMLVNVMPKETFDAGHIPHSINLPVAEIEKKARQVLPLLDREITVYCMGST
ncbi:MAG TPA: rhodanese-like domain-containing protein [Methylomirabilota bacterium]|nr:rhodanese-like domain-containing protein [Methylomirabilota bacterium]